MRGKFSQKYYFSIPAMNQGTIIRVRTRDNLLELLKTGRSGWWIVAEYREPTLRFVEVYSWDGDLVLRGECEPSQFERRDLDSRLNLAFKNAKIELVNPPLIWKAQNSVNYV